MGFMLVKENDHEDAAEVNSSNENNPNHPQTTKFKLLTCKLLQSCILVLWTKLGVGE